MVDHGTDTDKAGATGRLVGGYSLVRSLIPLEDRGIGGDVPDKELPCFDPMTSTLFATLTRETVYKGSWDNSPGRDLLLEPPY